MSKFLVEVYVPRGVEETQTPLLEGISGIRRQLSHDGSDVELLRTIFVPEDETCFYLFEGRSDEAVRDVAAQSGLQVQRVMEAICVPGSAK